MGMPHPVVGVERAEQRQTGPRAVHHPRRGVLPRPHLTCGRAGCQPASTLRTTSAKPVGCSMKPPCPPGNSTGDVPSSSASAVEVR